MSFEKTKQKTCYGYKKFTLPFDEKSLEKQIFDEENPFFPPPKTLKKGDITTNFYLLRINYDGTYFLQKLSFFAKCIKRQRRIIKYESKICEHGFKDEYKRCNHDSEEDYKTFLKNLDKYCKIISKYDEVCF